MEVLYKYMPVKRAFSCLPEIGDGSLRATQPAALNDPFECALALIKVFYEENPMSGSMELITVLNQINSAAPRSQDDIEEAYERFGSQFWRELLLEQLSTRYGVVSFSAVKDEPLMWSYYAGNAAGFVIAYSKHHLETLVMRAGTLRAVRYANQSIPLPGYQPLSDEGNVGTLLSSKALNWEHEKEWRLIVELDKTIGLGVRDGFGYPVNVLRVPNPAVIGVYCTDRTPKAAVAEIRNRISDPNNRYTAQRVTRMVRSDTGVGYKEEGT